MFGYILISLACALYDIQLDILYSGQLSRLPSPRLWRNRRLFLMFCIGYMFSWWSFVFVESQPGDTCERVVLPPLVLLGDEGA